MAVLRDLGDIATEVLDLASIRSVNDSFWLRKDHVLVLSKRSLYFSIIGKHTCQVSYLPCHFLNRHLPSDVLNKMKSIVMHAFLAEQSQLGYYKNVLN